MLSQWVIFTMHTGGGRETDRHTDRVSTYLHNKEGSPVGVQFLAVLYIKFSGLLWRCGLSHGAE